MMVATSHAAFQQAEKYLQAVSNSIFRISENAGDAAKVKLINNLLAAANLVAGAQALVLGEKMGLNPRTLLDVIQASSGASWMTGDRMTRALAGDFAPRAHAHILAKDVGLAMAWLKNENPRYGEFAHEIFQATLQAGLRDEDDAAVWKVLR
jgi:3-hydroxyisobutyrate dehydrogenase